MGILILISAFLFVFYVLKPPVEATGDAPYRGGPDRERMFLFRVFAYFAILIVTSALFQSEFALGFVVVAIGAMEFHFLRNYKSVEPVAAMPVIEVSETSGAREISIPTPSDLWAREEERLDRIAQSGSIGEVLAVCAAHLESGSKAESIAIPRWLSKDEYFALVRLMQKKGWTVRYSHFCRFTERPKLVIYQVFYSDCD